MRAFIIYSVTLVIDDDMHAIIKDIRNAHKGDIDSAPPKTLTEHFEEILEKAESFAGTSKQKLAYIFSQFLKIKPTETNIDNMADMLWSVRMEDYTQTYEVYGYADCSGCEHKEKCLYKYDPQKDADKNKVMKINEH